MGKLQQSVTDRQDRIVGILRHSGPATAQHLADVLRVDVVVAAEDVGALLRADRIEPLRDRVDGVLQYVAVNA